MANKIRLGVNLDHVATLKKVRGGKTLYPDLIFFMNESKRAGADQITLHLREDRRHIQDKDLSAAIKSKILPINMEMAVTEEMISIACKLKPDFVCLVPEKRQELTTEGGLDVVKKKKQIQLLIQKLNKKNIQVSTFIGPDLKQVQASYDVGAFACEFHTGHWVEWKNKKKETEWKKLLKAAQFCHELGMKVHAGHGLDFESTAQIKSLPFLEEVNIGHFLVCDALRNGLYSSVQEMIRVLES